MQKNGWMDLLEGLLGMQSKSAEPAARDRSASHADSDGWAATGKPMKNNRNYSLTKPNFDPLDYSQTAYIKLLKRHDAISKRIDREIGASENRAQTVAESVRNGRGESIPKVGGESGGKEQTLCAKRRSGKARKSAERLGGSEPLSEADTGTPSGKRRGRPRKEESPSVGESLERN